MEASAVPLLQGPRVQLRAQHASDVPALFAVYSDPHVMRYWSCPAFARIEQAQEPGPLALNRVEADVDPRNIASLRLLERMGFIRKGLLRERWPGGDEVQDSAIYGLLARDHAATSTTGAAS